MARPTTISREQILEAARRLFLEEGFSASTAAIARAAGVSEGSIFKRFATKEALFVAAMSLAAPRLDLDARVGRGDLRAQLVEVGLGLIAFYREMMPRIMRLWAHCDADGPTPLQLMCRGEETPLPVRLMNLVTEYLEAEMNLGRLRRADPRVVARLFVSPMHNYVFFELLGGGHHAASQPNAEAFAEGVVDSLWRGVAPAADDEERGAR